MNPIEALRLIESDAINKASAPEARLARIRDYARAAIEALSANTVVPDDAETERHLSILRAWATPTSVWAAERIAGKPDGLIAAVARYRDLKERYATDNSPSIHELERAAWAVADAALLPQAKGGA